VVDGLHFVGLHFLRKRKSALLYGVGEDAGIVADTIAAPSIGVRRRSPFYGPRRMTVKRP
jgi:hypothetical protein